MTEYKVAWRIIQKNLGILMIYFLLLAGLYYRPYILMDTQKEQNVKENISKVAIVSNGKEYKIINTLMEYFKQIERIEVVEIENNNAAEQQDALRHGRTDVIIYPEEEIPVKTAPYIRDELIKDMKYGSSYKSAYVNELIDHYLFLWNGFYAAEERLSDAEVEDYILSAAKKEVKVLEQDDTDSLNIEKNMNRFANYTLFTAVCITVIGISNIFIAFKRKGIRYRLAGSMQENKRTYLNLMASSLMYLAVSWGMHLFVFWGIFQDEVFSVIGAAYSLNMLTIHLSALGIAIISSNFMNSPTQVSLMANIVGLCLSFLSGTFIDQTELSSEILNIAKFTPGYWFIKNNNSISLISEVSQSQMMDLAWSGLIQIGFMTACITVSLLWSSVRSSYEGAVHNGGITSNHP